MPLPDLTGIVFHAAPPTERSLEVMVVSAFHELREGKINLNYTPNGRTCFVSFSPPLVVGWPRMGDRLQAADFYVTEHEGQRCIWGQGTEGPVDDWRLLPDSIEAIKKAWAEWVPKENV